MRRSMTPQQRMRMRMRMPHAACACRALPGEGAGRPCKRVDRWWLRRRDEDAERTPVLSSSGASSNGDKRPVDLAAASAVLLDAEDTLCGGTASESARIEYCNSLGVDYSRAAKYVPIVASLERLLGSEDTEPMDLKDQNIAVPMAVDDATAIFDVTETGTTRVRIIGMSEAAFLSMLSSGRCPMCGHDGHLMAMCPHLPDDLRPFA